MSADLQVLLNRFETEQPSRELDGLLEQAMTGKCQHFETEDFRIVAVDGETLVNNGFRCAACKFELWSACGGNRQDGWHQYPKYSSSLEAAIALAEKTTTGLTVSGLMYAAWGRVAKNHNLHIRNWNTDKDGPYDGALAMALCAALLSSLISDQRDAVFDRVAPW